VRRDQFEGYTIRWSTGAPGCWYADIVEAVRVDGEWTYMVVTPYFDIDQALLELDI
jgi:hypothetical protein